MKASGPRGLRLNPLRPTNPASHTSTIEKKAWSTGSLGPLKTDPPSILPLLPDATPPGEPLPLDALAPGMRVRLNSPVLAVAHLEVQVVDHEHQTVSGWHEEVEGSVTVPISWCGNGA